MTQTSTPLAPAPSTVTTPLTGTVLRQAAFAAADVVSPDGTLVYPGIKLLWFGDNTCDGATAEADIAVK